MTKEARLSFRYLEKAAFDYDLEYVRCYELPTDATSLDLFYAVSVLDLVGEKERALQLLTSRANILEQDNLLVLLRSCLFGSGGADYSKILGGLLVSALDQPQVPFVRGMYFLQLGLRFLAANNFDLAYDSLEKSDAEFEAGGFHAHAWFARFNCVRCSEAYLANKTLELFAILGRLEESALKLNSIGTARALWLLGFSWLCCGEYRRAESVLSRALQLSEQRRNISGISTTLIDLINLCLLAKDRVELTVDLDELFQKARKLQGITAVHAETIAAQLDLYKNNEISADVILRSFTNWDHSNIPFLYVRQLCEILFEKVYAENDIDLLNVIVKEYKARPQLRNLEMIASDLRFFEVIIAEQTKNYTEFFYLMAQIQKHTCGFLSQERRHALDQLLNPQRTSGLEAVTLVLDSVNALLIVDGSRRSLLKFPLVERLLRLLILNRKGYSISRLFAALYGDDFIQANHLKRIESLIVRARMILGDKDTILRRDGKILLHPKIQARLEDTSELHSRPEKVPETKGLEISRGDRILAVLASEKKKFKLHEICTSLPYSRRSIQTELASLTDSGKIRREGKARATAYFIDTHAEA